MTQGGNRQIPKKSHQPLSVDMGSEASAGRIVIHKKTITDLKNRNHQPASTMQNSREALDILEPYPSTRPNGKGNSIQQHYLSKRNNSTINTISTAQESNNYGVLIQKFSERSQGSKLNDPQTKKNLKMNHDLLEKIKQ